MKAISSPFVGLAGLLILSGCTHYLPAAVSSASLDSKYQTPVQVVTGRSSATYFFIFGPFGDDSLLAAYGNAIKKDDGDSLVNVSVDRKLFCFPHCGFSIYTRIETIVHGTLVRYTGNNGQRLANAFPKVTVAQDATKPLGEDVEKDWMGVFKEIPKGTWIELLLKDGNSHEGEFRWYSYIDRNVMIKPKGTSFLGGKVIPFDQLANLRVVSQAK